MREVEADVGATSAVTLAGGAGAMAGGKVDRWAKSTSSQDRAKASASQLCPSITAWAGGKPEKTLTSKSSTTFLADPEESPRASE